MKFEGVIPAVITPFDEHGRIRFDHLRDHVDWLVDSGCTGITGNGTMGEASSLTREERGQVIGVIVDAAAGRVPVIAGVSAMTARDAIAYGRDATEAGAAAVMCLPPPLYAGDIREMRAFFEDVVQGIGVPFQLYNNPHATCGIDLLPKDIAALADIEGFAPVKECSGDARRIAELRQLGVETMVGGDDWPLEGAAAGAIGWVSGVANVAPRACVELWRLASNGDLDPARDLYARIAILARMDMTPKLVQYFKAAMDAVGRYGGPCRPPRLALAETELRTVRDGVAALQPIRA